MYEIKSIKDGTYGAYEYSTPVPADYSFKQMLAMARDIANANGYEASIYDDENEMIITISPEQYSMGLAAIRLMVRCGRVQGRSGFRPMPSFPSRRHGRACRRVSEARRWLGGHPHTKRTEACRTAGRGRDGEAWCPDHWHVECDEYAKQPTKGIITQ